MHDEFSKIEWLTSRLDLKTGSPDAAAIIVGIGDDAAVVDFGSRPAIVTVDTQVEGVHFKRDLIASRQLGRRAVVAASSDVWAMGSTPSAAVVALTLPNDFSDSDFRELIEGLAEASRQTGARIIGGNLSAGGLLSVTTTVFGIAVDRAVTRDGARPGDRIYVTGTIGAAALGLAMSQAKPSHIDRAADFITRWKEPPLHGRVARELAKTASAAIDLSDGCLQDLQHVCDASDVGALVRSADLPTAPGYQEGCRALGLDPVELALTGGEDYELLFTAPPDRAIPFQAAPIGTIVEDRGVCVVDGAGRPVELDHSGYRHFS